MIRPLLLAVLLAACGGVHAPATPALAQAQPPQADSAPPAAHVIMVSVDGLRPEFYLDADYPSPMMHRMAENGARAGAVRGVTPTVTYPSHTTLVTGALPAKHGIYHNRPFEPSGQTGRWYMESEMIRVPALWDALQQAGLTSAAISWPVSAGAPISWNVPEFWSVSGREGALTGVQANTAALRARVTPSGLLEEMEQYAMGAFPDYYWGQNLSREDAVGDMAAYLIEQKKPNLLLVHLNQTDYSQHANGRDHPDVKLAVAAVDRAIARMVEAAERAGTLERTAFIVTGDHGFVDIRTRIAPNVWLVEAGLQEDRPDRGAWRATFHPGGGSAFLHLREAGDTAALAMVKALLGRLPAEVRSLFRIVGAAELRELGADPESVLALAAHDGVAFTDDTSGPAVREGTGGGHGYFPDLPNVQTGFVAWGAGVAQQKHMPTMQLIDVAPTVAALFGVAFAAPDGTVDERVLARPSPVAGEPSQGSRP